MKLHYFSSPKGNFGDDLNPWLWRQLVPELLDEASDTALIGMGTILEPWFVSKIPAIARKVVLGAGAGMSSTLVQIDDTWSIFGVRGPLTASYLGLDLSLSTTDPAMMVRDLLKRPDTPSGGVGFMPHHVSNGRWNWQFTCEQAGLIYLDPYGDPVVTLDKIANCSKVLTEAMHGAIVADAFRIPWFPIQISQTNYVGKWHDWAASIRMPIHFKPLPDLYDPALRFNMAKLLLTNPKAAAYQSRQKSNRQARNLAVSLLRSYANEYEFYLSDDAHLDVAIDRFNTALKQLRKAFV